MSEGDSRQEPDVAEPRRRFRPPVAGLVAGGLALLIALGSALGSALVFTGPRRTFGVLPSPKPLVQTPPPAAVATGTPPPIATGSRPDLGWIVILVLCLVGAFLVFVVVRYVLRRLRDRQRGGPGGLGDEALDLLGDDPSVETSAPYLRRGLRRALDVLDGDREPGDAIVQAWLGLQEAAEDAGYRRLESETPTEFTSRILERTGVDGSALATLRRLYLAVRFGDAVSTARDVAAARAALQTLDAQWAAADAEAAP